MTKQPQTADASLINEQPTDTGSSCFGVGFASSTPSISENIMNGVTVGNIPIRDKKWFVLRVSYGRIVKAKEFIKSKGIHYYIPICHKLIMKQRRKHIVTSPLLPSLIFIHTSAEKVDELIKENRAISTEGIPMLSYYYDHTLHVEGTPNHNPPLTIRDEDMNNFIKLTSVKNPHIIPVTSNNIRLKLGVKVIVKEGEFKGVKGHVARIAGQQRVVIELFTDCFVATAYIAKSAMEVIGIDTNNGNQ